MRLYILPLLFCSLFAQAQESDEAKIHQVVLTTLDILTGEKGEERDWERFKNQFTKDARMVLVLPVKMGDGKKILSWTLDHFIEKAGPNYVDKGFLEEELWFHVDVFNGVANVFQGFHAKQDDYNEKGVNSFQLVNTGEGWKITSITWSNEDEMHPLPKKYKR